MISDFKIGDSVKGFGLVSDIAPKTARNGSTRMTGRITDASGSIDLVCWGPTLFDGIGSGDAVAYRGQVGSFNDRPQLDVELIRLARESDRDYGLDEAKLIRSAPVDLPETFGQLDKLLKQRLGAASRALWDLFIERYGDDYRRHPAAKSVHHAFAGGLLMHSASMAHMAASLMPHYEGQGQSFDVDVLLLGAALHDIGKLFEIGGLPGSDYTDGGCLIGHITIGCRIWHQLCDATNAPARLRVGVEHIILSHHGSRDTGATVEPKTPEALAVSALDRLDSSLHIAWSFTAEAGHRARCWPLGGEVFASLEDEDYMTSRPRGIVLRGQEPVEKEVA